MSGLKPLCFNHISLSYEDFRATPLNIALKKHETSMNKEFTRSALPLGWPKKTVII
ncbi:MAG: hypothetical protein WCL70_13820 [Paludibacter sp.]